MYRLKVDCSEEFRLLPGGYEYDFRPIGKPERLPAIELSKKHNLKIIYFRNPDDKIKSAEKM